jgi:hypothetical protein
MSGTKIIAMINMESLLPNREEQMYCHSVGRENQVEGSSV